MARSSDAHEPDHPDSFASRLRKKYGEGVNPEVSLGGERDEPAPGATDELLGFAFALRKKHDEGVDPKISPEGDRQEPARGATSELLERLAEHGLKSPRYTIEGEVACGGMGAILRVWDQDLRRHLAMKVILGRGGALDSGAAAQVDTRVLARFLEEAQVTGQLDHPGIVPVHELGLDSDGRVYFTMKLVKGRDLKAIFDLVRHEQEGWNETRALGVILKVCEAMAYAHAKGVIHRDLKPANVMVGGFGEVFVMDWGLARVLGRRDSHDLRLRSETPHLLSSVTTGRREEAADSSLITMDGDVMGTPAYMSPEQARGEIDKLSPRSDVYAIGAMLYHLLARHAPNMPPNSKTSDLEVLRRVREGHVPLALLEIRKDVPEELVAICEKAMMRDVGLRYVDTLALAEDLRAFLEHRVVAAYETGAIAELKKWVARNKPLAATIAAAIVIAIGGLALNAHNQSQAREEIEGKNTSLALATKTAQEKAVEAEAERKLAQQRADDVLSLSAIQDLQDLIERADALWPAHPENIAKCEAWLGDARALIEGRPRDSNRGIKAKPSLEDHKRKLAEVEERGRAQPTKEGDGGVSQGSKQVTWQFDSSEDRWWHAQLTKLIADLTSFSDSKRGLFSSGITPEHGWGVEKRLDFAATIEEKSLTGAEPQQRWKAAIASIHDRAQCPKYDGLVIAPILGLLPIERDARSGLWEFAHLQTGEPAERGADGKLTLKAATGLVFVLIPGGNFMMGAQGTDPSGANFDPQARELESPVHPMTLAPYFISKYEMTQSQWLRITGTNPSYYGAGISSAMTRITVLNPVEQMNWFEATETLKRMDLALPTEAQWEYACRAGTQTPWSSGKTVESLMGFANVADEGSKDALGPGWVFEPGFRDGFDVHSPVGSFAPNDFGLHDMHGNVVEWCRDIFRGPEPPAGTVDAERPAAARGQYVSRGGSFGDTALYTRSSARNFLAPVFRNDDLGLRPVKEITPVRSGG